MIKIPPHTTCKTRFEANLLGQEGPCVDDIRHFSDNCRTHFANFPAVDVGTSTCTSFEGLILGQTSYKLGTLSGPWQGSTIVWVPFLFYVLQLISKRQLTRLYHWKSIRKGSLTPTFLNLYRRENLCISFSRNITVTTRRRWYHRTTPEMA